MCVCVYPLVDDGGHGDLQELLLQRDEGQQAAVEEAQQLQNPGQAEQNRDPGVLEEGEWREIPDVQLAVHWCWYWRLMSSTHLLVALLHHLVAGVAPDGQMLTVVLHHQLRHLQQQQRLSVIGWIILMMPPPPKIKNHENKRKAR